jgi:hypothetical protein
MPGLDKAPTNEDVKKFLFLSPMLDSALNEMREFAKKKQDGLVSETKVKLINRLLTDLKQIARNEPSASYLDLLSESGLPQNSDAVLVLGQYRSALNSFRSNHLKMIDHSRTWITREWLAENEEGIDHDPELGDDDDDDEEAEDAEDAEDDDER